MRTAMEIQTSSPATSPPAQPSSWLTPIATATGNLFLVFGTICFATLTLLVSVLPHRPRMAVVNVDHPDVVAWHPQHELVARAGRGR